MAHITEAVQFIRDKHNIKRGVMVAILLPGTNQVRFGWSLCSRQKGRADVFDPEFGKQLAIGRTKRDSEVPRSMIKDMRNFYHRWLKYFKDKEIATTIVDEHTAHHNFDGERDYPTGLHMRLIQGAE